MSADTIQIDDLTFEKTMIFDLDGYEVVNEVNFNAEGGVYIAVINDVKWYIGSYSNTFQYRWVNLLKNKNCVNIARHFKYVPLAEQAKKENTKVEVYSLPMFKIAEQFKNKYINYSGIETALINQIPTPFNKSGTRRQ